MSFKLKILGTKLVLIGLISVWFEGPLAFASLAGLKLQGFGLSNGDDESLDPRLGPRAFSLMR